MKQRNIGSQSSPDVSDNFQLIERVYKDQSAINDLNSYRNWSMFGLQAESVYDAGSDKKGGYATEEQFIDATFWNKNAGYVGVKSLFNNVHAVNWGSGEDGTGGYRIPTNTPLLDSQRVRQAIRDRGGCSIKELCEASRNNNMGRAIYNYSDFMYCKHLGKMSNNYLITLRRFPYPSGDHINYIDPKSDNKFGNVKGRENQSHMPDVGRLVTWLGTPGNDIAEILKYEVLMPYKPMQSGIHEINGTAESGGILGAICNSTSSTYSASVLHGRGGATTLGYMSKSLCIPEKFLASPPDNSWLYHRDMSKAYGPTDVIAQTHIRAGGEDGGLKFEQNINLTFDYELRAYDGINTKTAIVDLISNILAVTFTDGKFWGGGYHANGPSQSSVFTNLPIFKLGSGGKPASFNEMKNAVVGSIDGLARAANGGRPITSGKDLIGMAMNLLSNAANMLVGGALNALGRPQKQGMDSLLNSNPVGLWHLTIGNPKHPIMSMGNMILDKVEIQQYGALGLDDMPTGIRVNVTLKHAMPRDRRQIEFMYHSGDFRMYIPMGPNVELMYMKAEDLCKNGAGSYTETHINAMESSDVNQTESNTDSMEFKESQTDKSKLLIGMFGMTDMVSIHKSSMEAHLGSSKAVTTEEAAENAKRAALEQAKADAVAKVADDKAKKDREAAAAVAVREYNSSNKSAK